MNHIPGCHQLQFWDAGEDESRKARDKALKQVSKHEFLVAVLDRISKTFKDGDTVTGEMIRWACEQTEPRITPHHHNGWGAVIMQLVRKKILIPTDKLVPMREPRSHARLTRLYILKEL